MDSVSDYATVSHQPYRDNPVEVVKYYADKDGIFYQDVAESDWKNALEKKEQLSDNDLYRFLSDNCLKEKTLYFNNALDELPDAREVLSSNQEEKKAFVLKKFNDLGLQLHNNTLIERTERPIYLTSRKAPLFMAGISAM